MGKFIQYKCKHPKTYYTIIIQIIKYSPIFYISYKLAIHITFWYDVDTTDINWSNINYMYRAYSATNKPASRQTESKHADFPKIRKLFCKSIPIFKMCYSYAIPLLQINCLNKYIFGDIFTTYTSTKRRCRCRANNFRAVSRNGKAVVVIITRFRQI